MLFLDTNSVYEVIFDVIQEHDLILLILNDDLDGLWVCLLGLTLIIGQIKFENIKGVVKQSAHNGVLVGFFFDQTDEYLILNNKTRNTLTVGEENVSYVVLLLLLEGLEIFRDAVYVDH